LPIPPSGDSVVDVFTETQHIDKRDKQNQTKEQQKNLTITTQTFSWEQK